jgi:hypothetical protein
LPLSFTTNVFTLFYLLHCLFATETASQHYHWNGNCFNIVELVDKRPKAKTALDVADLLKPLSEGSETRGSLKKAIAVDSFMSVASTKGRVDEMGEGSFSPSSLKASPLIPSAFAVTSSSSSSSSKKATKSRHGRDLSLLSEGKLYESVNALPQFANMSTETFSGGIGGGIHGAQFSSSSSTTPGFSSGVASSNPFDLVNAHLAASIALQSPEAAPTRHLQAAHGHGNSSSHGQSKTSSGSIKKKSFSSQSSHKGNRRR